jgi:Uncharacterized protein conserved in bacteria (DUF2252)
VGGPLCHGDYDPRGPLIGRPVHITLLTCQVAKARRPTIIRFGTMAAIALAAKSQARRLHRTVTVPSGRSCIDYYLRQLRDWKYSVEIEGMNATSMTSYRRMCGWTLARAGDRIAIAAYLGGSDKFDQALAEFGETYADQTERDHAALAAAVSSGRVQAEAGI